MDTWAKFCLSNSVMNWKSELRKAHASPSAWFRNVRLMWWKQNSFPCATVFASSKQQKFLSEKMSDLSNVLNYVNEMEQMKQLKQLWHLNIFVACLFTTTHIRKFWKGCTIRKQGALEEPKVVYATNTIFLLK